MIEERNRKSTAESAGVCHGCALGKSHRKEFHNSNPHNKATSILDRVHSDINGPFDVRRPEVIDIC